MSGKQPSNDNVVQLLILLMLTTSIPSLVFAKVNNEVMPENAHAQTYGSGWECKSGYQQNGNICDAIKVPDNAYLTNSPFGDGWKCNRGYRKDDKICVVIMIPAHAYLNSNGYDWQCDRGFKSQNKTCVAVKIPEHGYFVHSIYGDGWECERGYLARKDMCVPLIVPKNAHIDYSGHDWDCNPPYAQLNDQCELPASDY
ncbi:hypothetical protein AU255_10285 [Methyloprofundus sedimenti]|uniref:Uncharacterized protein n=1 Tax=Methyloprofundus sedimenti TaxID=1420851 RepID=A0A1V8M9H7_9GAMM|nr:hypothetical protein [Methyloprofundus sedimenti]OQK18199.1 hypothetical protein AU255_10285 [Methyloprofundus sedimenti]